MGQLVLVRLPDPVDIGRDPDSETGLAGMETLLLLVLGCAVQGPSKEGVIEDIKKLPLATQHDIVNCIQQVIITKQLSPLVSVGSQINGIWEILSRNRWRIIPDASGIRNGPI